MQDIRVNKALLLQTLHENRAKHLETYTKAKANYRDKVAEALRARAVEIKNGGRVDLYFDFPEPQDYSREYDLAIEMVKWAIGEEVSISEKDFKRYVLNEWEWTRTFAATTSSYVTA